LTQHFSTIEDFGIGFLCWQGYDGFRQALKTYSREHLFDLAAERLIYFNGLDDEARSLAQEFSIPFAGNADNFGILGGFKGLAEAMSSEVLLLLENDLPLIEPGREARRQIRQAVAAVRDGEVQVFRMRHRHKPGQKFTTLEKYRRYHGEGGVVPLRRILRPGKAKRLIGTALYAEQDPHEKFAEIDRQPQGWWKISTKHLPWTNQSIIVRRDFFLETIIAHAEENPSNRSVNGFPDIEKEWNCPKWRNSGWTIGAGRGLFTHERE
jgi:hypothetical protein